MNSNSKSISADLSISSRKKNPFAQSFDSKLSEFSDNNDVFDLNKKKTIDEYTGEEIYSEKKINSIGKQLVKDFNNSKHDTLVQNTKNFTFSKNSPEENIQSNVKDLDSENINQDLNPIDQFEISEKFCKKKSKIKQFNLDFGFGLDSIDGTVDNEIDKKTHNNPVKIFGSSWNKPLSSHSNMPKLLNAPKNKKKITFNFDKVFVQENRKKKLDLEILIPEEEEDNSNSEDQNEDEDGDEEHNSNHNQHLMLSHLSNNKISSGNKSENNSSSHQLEKFSSNSPKSCSQIQNSSGDSRSMNHLEIDCSQNQKSSKNIDCPYQNIPSNFELNGIPFYDSLAGAKTNPLPTCKNANKKHKGGFFLGSQRKAKRTLSINIQPEKDIKKFDLINSNELKDDSLIEEVDSNEEMNSSPNNRVFDPKRNPQRNIKMKINSKQSNYSKPGSQIINSIQSNNITISEFN